MHLFKATTYTMKFKTYLLRCQVRTEKSSLPHTIDVGRLILQLDLQNKPAIPTQVFPKSKVSALYR